MLMIKEKEWDNCPLSGISDMVELKRKAIMFSDDDISLLLAGGRTDELMEKLKLCKGP